MQVASGKRQVARSRWSNFCLLPSAFILLFLVACASTQSISTLDRNSSRIPVAAELADFYDEYGGRRIFGDPITDGFVAGEDGRLIQYFHAMRLEYDAASQTVIIYPLGEWALAGLKDPVPAPVPDNSPSRRFPETNLTVQDEFLSFYEANDGERLLGVPISPQLDEEDLRVQYFVNGRLEWRPELPTEQRIRVSYLGQAHFDAEMVFFYINNQLARPVPFAGITQVDVFASVGSAVLYAGDEQILYVTILTPEGRPVDGIPAEVTATYGNSSTTISLGRTDAKGHIIAPLPDFNARPGQQVQLRTVVYSANDEIIGSDSLTFKTWW